MARGFALSPHCSGWGGRSPESQSKSLRTPAASPTNRPPTVSPNTTRRHYGQHAARDDPLQTLEHDALQVNNGSTAESESWSAGSLKPLNDQSAGNLAQVPRCPTSATSDRTASGFVN